MFYFDPDPFDDLEDAEEVLFSRADTDEEFTEEPDEPDEEEEDTPVIEILPEFKKVTIRQFLEGRNYAEETVRMYLQRRVKKEESLPVEERAFTNHLSKIGTTIYLDKFLYDELDRKYPYPKPVTVTVDNAKYDDLKAKYDNLLHRYAQAQEIIIGLQSEKISVESVKLLADQAQKNYEQAKAESDRNKELADAAIAEQKEAKKIADAATARADDACIELMDARFQKNKATLMQKYTLEAMNNRRGLKKFRNGITDDESAWINQNVSRDLSSMYPNLQITEGQIPTKIVTFDGVPSAMYDIRIK